MRKAMIESWPVGRRPSNQTAETNGTTGLLFPGDGEPHADPGFDFAGLISGLDVIIWEADAKTWQFTYVSSRAEHILGYPATQWFTEPDFWANHIHPADRKRAVEFCIQATAQGEDHQFEYRAIARDGHIVWLHDIVRVIQDEAGQPCFLRGVMVDITDRKRAEEDRRLAEDALQASEEKFRTLVETANDAIVTGDVEGNIVEFNPGAEECLATQSARCWASR